MCGVSDLHIQHRLLSKPDLTLKTTMQIALGMETAAYNAKGPFRKVVKLRQQPRERHSSSLDLNQEVANSKCRHAHTMENQVITLRNVGSKILNVTAVVKWDV